MTANGFKALRWTTPRSALGHQATFPDFRMWTWTFCPALQEGAILVTDDYRLQNAYKNAGGTVESVANAPSKHVWSWEGRCVGCGATSPLSGDVRRSKNDVVGECRVCGSPVKVKRKTS